MKVAITISMCPLTTEPQIKYNKWFQRLSPFQQLVFKKAALWQLSEDYGSTYAYYLVTKENKKLGVKN